MLRYAQERKEMRNKRKTKQTNNNNNQKKPRDKEGKSTLKISTWLHIR